MKFREIGSQEHPTILILQQEELDEAVEKLADQFHIIVPVMTAGQSWGDLGETGALVSKLCGEYGGKLYALCSREEGWEAAKRLLDHPKIQSEKVIIAYNARWGGQLIVSQLSLFAEERRLREEAVQ